MTKKTTDDKPTDEQATDRQPSGPVTPPANAEPTTPAEPPIEAPAPIEVVVLEPPAQPEPITEEDADRVVLRFVGPGTVSGVPPRDLTLHDVERLVPEQIRDATLAAPGRKPAYEAV